jgi:hypothetical protein
MPFQFPNLSVLAYANGFTHWHYQSATDTLGQIMGPNYFGSAGDMLARNDLLVLVGTDGLRLARIVGATPGSVTLGPQADSGRYLLQVSVPALNAVSESYAPVPYPGTITAVRAAIDAATTAASVLTTRIAGNAVTGGALNIPVSAAGAAFLANPTAQNAVAVGQVVSVQCNGAGGTAARAQVVIEILRT